MSNVLLNKLKSIDASRKNLKNILTTKGVTPVNESLDGLISEVGQLNKYESITPEWTGVTPEEEPDDYYTGDEDWKALGIDPKAIMEADTNNYDVKVFYLIRMSDNMNLDDSLNIQYTFTYNYSSSYVSYTNFRFSDTPNVVNNYNHTHTWDKSKDIEDPVTHERFRWVICYGNAVGVTETEPCGNASYGFNGTNIIPEIIYAHQGHMGVLDIMDNANTYYIPKIIPNSNQNYPYVMSYASMSNRRKQYTSYGVSPKYVYIGEDCVIGWLGGYYSSDQPMQGRIRTIYCDGDVLFGLTCSSETLEYIHIPEPKAQVLSKPDIEFYWARKYRDNYSDNRNSYYSYVSSTISCNNANIRTHIHIPKWMSNVQFAYCNNMYVETNEMLSFAYTDHCYNSSFLISKVLYEIGNARYSGNYLYYYTCTGRYGESSDSADTSNNKTFTDNCYYDFNVVSYVNAYAFEHFSSNLRNYVKINVIRETVNTNAFYGCLHLYPIIKVEYYEGAEDTTRFSIGDGAFRKSSLQVLDMSKSRINTISGTNGWLSESNIQSVIFSPYITSLPSYCFYQTSVRYVTLNDVLTSIGSYAFCRAENVQSITLPETVQSIGAYAFAEMENLVSLDMGKTRCTTLGDYLCYLTPKLTTVVLPRTLTNIASYMFRQSGIETVDIPDLVTNIYQYAFYQCDKLKTITGGENVTTVGPYTFEYCRSLERTPVFPKVSSFDSSYNAFSYLSEDTIIELPSNVALQNSAYQFTNGSIILPENFKPITDVYVHSARWSVRNFLRFLESLPTNTTLPSYTIYLGQDSVRVYASGDYTGAPVVWTLYKNKYVGYIGDEFVLANEQLTTDFVTVENYVATKKWRIG